VDIQLINQDGKEVKILQRKNMSPGENTIQLDTSDIPAGMYFVRMKTAEFVLAEKLVILK